MNHSDIEVHMANYLDGHLPLGRRALFDAHLDGCEECSQELGAMRATIAALKGLPDPEPPPNLAIDVMRRVRAGEARPAWWDAIVSWLASLRSPAFAVPATAALTAAGVLLLTGRIELPRLAVPEPSSRVAAREPLVRVPGGDGRSPAILGIRTSEPGVGYSGPRRVTVRTTGPWDGYRVAGTENSNQLWNTRGIPVGPSLGYIADARVSRAMSGANGLEGRRAHTVGWSRALEPVSSTTAIRGDSVDRSQEVLDDRLRRLQRDPTRFARRQARLSVAEQELWGRKLSERAAELGVVDELIDTLRADGDPASGALADYLEAGNAGAH